jgi:hypothetical protein
MELNCSSQKLAARMGSKQSDVEVAAARKLHLGTRSGDPFAPFSVGRRKERMESCGEGGGEGILCCEKRADKIFFHTYALLSEMDAFHWQHCSFLEQKKRILIHALYFSPHPWGVGLRAIAFCCKDVRKRKQTGVKTSTECVASDCRRRRFLDAIGNKIESRE